MSDHRWMIVGLGNPGTEYAQTRHNVGFMVIEQLGRQVGIAGKAHNKAKALVGTGQLEGVPVVLVQPLTYMNLSGQAVIPLMQYYKVPLERLLVVYDEAALPFGKIRVRPSGSSAGQKGVQSIIEQLGGQKDFARLRVGIGAPEGQKSMPDHVLSKFSTDEQTHLPKVLETSIEAIGVILKQGIEPAMTQFNGVEVTKDII